MIFTRQFAQFCCIGLINTGIHVVVYYALLQFSSPLWIANILGYVIATVFSYCANAYWTFQKMITLTGLLRFCLGNSICLLWVISISWLSQHVMLSKNIALIITITGSPLINYITHKKWTFKN